MVPSIKQRVRTNCITMNQHIDQTSILLDAKNRDDLAILWPTLYPPSRPVVEFYRKDGPACFSNFYQHDKVPFTIPDCCWDRLAQAQDQDQQQGTTTSGTSENGAGVLPRRTTYVTFSEKSIMLCKAAVMGDAASYTQISEAPTPADAKWLGRRVNNFDEEVWQSVLLTVAFESVYQKFRELGMLERRRSECNVLLGTGNALIVEASPPDSIWGIGRGIGHPDCQDPRKWRNGNVLGFALVKARNVLVAEQSRT